MALTGKTDYGTGVGAVYLKQLPKCVRTIPANQENRRAADGRSETGATASGARCGKGFHRRRPWLELIVELKTTGASAPGTKSGSGLEGARPRLR